MAKYLSLLVTLFIGAVSAHAADKLTINAPSLKNSTPLTSPVTVSNTYQLAPYDVVEVAVTGQDDLKTKAKLGADGTILLPMIGNVTLKGKTVAQANELIQKRYADGGFVKDPNVWVTVLEYRKKTFSILGQVNHPGIYELPEGAHMTIVDAVLIAGGFSRMADQNSVDVKRTIEGKPHILQVKVGEMINKADLPPFDIKAGDMINVKQSLW